MRKFMLLFVLVALAVPVAALASGTPTAASTANQICKLAQTSMGATLFAQTYATNASKADAFGKCVSKNAATAKQRVEDVYGAGSAPQFRRDPWRKDLRAVLRQQHLEGQGQRRERLRQVCVAGGLGVGRRTGEDADHRGQVVQGGSQGECHRFRSEVRNGPRRVRQVRRSDLEDQVGRNCHQDGEGRRIHRRPSAFFEHEHRGTRRAHLGLRVARATQLVEGAMLVCNRLCDLDNSR